MGSLTILGDKTKSVYLKGIQAHQLHQEFVVAEGEVITVGMPVKLNAAGEVVPAEAAEPSHNIIGYSIHNGIEEEFVTVGMKAYAVVWAMPSAAVDAGPVQMDGPNATDPMYMSYAAAAAAGNTTGWALDAAGEADELIRVAVG